MAMPTKALAMALLCQVTLIVESAESAQMQLRIYSTGRMLHAVALQSLYTALVADNAE